MWKIKIFYSTHNYGHENLESQINNFISENSIIEFEIHSSLTRHGEYDNFAMVILKYKEREYMKL